MTIAEKIRASGVTDKQISEATGVPIPTAWRWRKGLTHPNIVNVAALARAIGCKPADLIPDEAT
jgi:transcriptional regulator with XRE-family HTH domain